MIGRQSPMAMPLRLSNAAEVINVLGLPLSPEGLLELLKRDGVLLLIAINRSSENTVHRVYRGVLSVYMAWATRT
jgi:hypothetical protein